MAVPFLDIVKNWLTGTLVVEADWDNIKVPLMEWAESITNDLDQLRIDTQGSTYSLDNNGLANLPNPIRDWSSSISALNWIFTGQTQFTGTFILPPVFYVDQATADYTIFFSDPAAARQITFEDAGGDDFVCYLAANQIIYNKTLVAPIIATDIILSQTTHFYDVQWADPAANRVLTINDPVGNDVFVFADMQQTLTRKTLTTPTIGSFVNANHTHANAAGGGTLTWSNIFSVAGAGNHDHTSTTTGSSLGSNTVGSGQLVDTLTWAEVFPTATNGNHDHTTTSLGGSLGSNTVGSGQLVDTLTWAEVFATANNGNHSHSSTSTGGTLDWDNCWADAVHDHTSSAEGGTLSLTSAFTGILDVTHGGTGVNVATGTGTGAKVVLNQQPYIWECMTIGPYIGAGYRMADNTYPNDMTYTAGYQQIDFGRYDTSDNNWHTVVSFANWAPSTGIYTIRIEIHGQRTDAVSGDGYVGYHIAVVYFDTVNMSIVSSNAFDCGATYACQWTNPFSNELHFQVKGATGHTVRWTYELWRNQKNT